MFFSCLIWLIACSPTSPSSSAVLTIRPDMAIFKVGDVQLFTATLDEGGVSKTVTAQWRSDSDTIATIDSRGSLVARSPGDVTVYASTATASARRQLHIVLNMQGHWVGRSVIRACGLEQGFGFPCTGIIGLTDPLDLQFTQVGDAVSGTTKAVQSFSGSVTGEIKYDGSYSVSGTLLGEEGATATIVSWNGQLKATGNKMDGVFVVRIRYITIFGVQQLFYQCDFNAER